MNFLPFLPLVLVALVIVAGHTYVARCDAKDRAVKARWQS